MSPQKNSRKSVHFIGIGGIGMSALARYYISQKWAVSGSDAVKHTITDGLKKDGVTVKIGHKKGNLPARLDRVITSQAITKDNIELKEAIQRGVDIYSYPEAIGTLTEQYSTIAIAGSHGKSTTTALSALTLIKGGFDPTVIVGTNLKEFGGINFRAGKGDFLVLEADEYGRAFHHYSPFIAIVTNIDKEHLDIYKNLNDVKKSFLLFLGNTQEGGAFILNRDDKNLYSLKKQITTLAKKKDIVVIWYSAKDSSTIKIKKSLTIFGEHNISNATAAYTLGTVFDMSEKNILAAIGSYAGAWRRMEYRGTTKLKGLIKNALVYDDYAHHPTEVKATLAAFRAQFPTSPLVCVFQPHQGKRLEALFKEFTTAFHEADLTIILPLYKVRGRDEKFTRDSAALAASIAKQLKRGSVVYLENPSEIQDVINEFFISPFSTKSLTSNKKEHSNPPVIVMMGAGDIVKHTEKLLLLA